MYIIYRESYYAFIWDMGQDEFFWGFGLKVRCPALTFLKLKKRRGGEGSCGCRRILFRYALFVGGRNAELVHGLD